MGVQRGRAILTHLTIYFLRGVQRIIYLCTRIKDFYYDSVAFTLGEGKFISPRTKLSLHKAKPYAENIYLCMQIVRGVPIRKGRARQLINREYIPNNIYGRAQS